MVTLKINIISKYYSKCDILQSGTILTQWLTDSVTNCLIQLMSTAFLLKRKAAVSLLLEIIFFCFPIQVKLAINRTTAHNCQLHLSLSIYN
jgi:hypothetical protein